MNARGCGVFLGARTGVDVECWGGNANGQATPPFGVEFSDVTVGRAHACGVEDSTGFVLCWGRNDDGQATPPSGTFTSLAAGYRHTCGLRSDATVACWGNALAIGNVPSTGGWVSIRAGLENTCVTRGDGYQLCFGDYPLAFVGANMLDVDADEDQLCTLRDDFVATCQGDLVR